MFENEDLSTNSSYFVSVWYYFQAPGEQMFILCFVYKGKTFLLTSLQRECSGKNFACGFKYWISWVYTEAWWFLFSTTNWNVKTMQESLPGGVDKWLLVCVNGSVCTVQVMLEKYFIC